MQIQLTISDAIAKQALQYGLLDSKNIETLLINALNQHKKNVNQNAQWQATLAELSGSWQDFPSVEQLRADLLTEELREPF